LQQNFRGRLYTMYIVNTPSSIYLPWQLAKKFMEETTTKKIQFVKKQTPDFLFTYTRSDQVEEKYGGTAKNITTFWPPVFPSDQYFLSEQDGKNMVTKEQYRKMHASGELAKLKVSAQLTRTINTLQYRDLAENSLSSETNDQNATRDASPEKKAKNIENANYETTQELQHNRPNQDTGLIVKLHVYNAQEGDYVESMDENHNINLVAQHIVLREFRAYFIKKVAK